MILLFGFTETSTFREGISTWSRNENEGVIWLVRSAMGDLVRASGFVGRLKIYEDFFNEQNGLPMQKTRPVDYSDMTPDDYRICCCLLERELRPYSVYSQMGLLGTVFEAVELFLERNPSVSKFVLSAPPHSLVTFLLWRSAQRRGIRCSVLRPGPLMHQSVICGDFETQLCDELGAIDVRPRSPVTSEWIDLNQSAQSDYEPPYMESLRRRQRVVPRALRGAELIYNGSYGRIWQHFKTGRERAELRTWYEGNALQTLPSQKSCVVFLHLQPERTTVPEGGKFADQVLLIQRVRKILPESWKVLVREHPSTFLGGPQLVRDISFYQALSRLEGVELFTSHGRGSALIDSCDAVVTVTGTVGLEAALRGVPVGIFGNAPYKGCPGVTDLSTFRGPHWEPEKKVMDDAAIDLVRAFIERFDTSANGLSLEFLGHGLETLISQTKVEELIRTLVDRSML